MSPRLSVLFVVPAFIAFPLSGQDRAVEVAFNAASVSLSSTSGVTSTRLAITESGLGVGVVIAERLALEPSLVFIRSDDNLGDFTIVRPGLGVQYFVGSQKQGIFVRPYGFVSITSMGIAGIPGFDFPDTTGGDDPLPNPRGTDPALLRLLQPSRDTWVQPGGGLGLGTRLPLADVISVRLELTGQYTSSVDTFDDAVQFAASAGMSVFLD